jgi:hypothetical protein
MIWSVSLEPKIAHSYSSTWIGLFMRVRVSLRFLAEITGDGCALICDWTDATVVHGPTENTPLTFDSALLHIRYEKVLAFDPHTVHDFGGCQENNMAMRNIFV